MNDFSFDIKNEVHLAEDRIRPHVGETKLESSSWLSEAGGAHVCCKLENLQVTGSFKIRGALNKLLSLSKAELARGVVAASTGNHGAAVAWSGKKLGADCLIFVPENAIPMKIESIERIGATVRRYGTDTVDTEVYARRFAEENKMTYVPPYNDLHVVAGQGTIAVELLRQHAPLDTVFVPVGGGGLVSGIAGYFKAVNPGARIIGCSPENSQVMMDSVKAGKIVVQKSLPTLSDGTAGGVEEDSITFTLCRNLVDEFVSVTEEEIKESLKLFIRNHRMTIEGAAAVAIASYLKTCARFKEKNVAIIISGANISDDVLKSIL